MAEDRLAAMAAAESKVAAVAAAKEQMASAQAADEKIADMAKVADKLAAQRSARRDSGVQYWPLFRLGPTHEGAFVGCCGEACVRAL